jgi:tetratricopeptide (TPR) repeat protein
LAYLHLGRHEEAEADRKLLGEACRNFPLACRQLEILHTQNGDAALAAVFLRALGHFRAHEPEVLNRLAWQLATGPEELRDAAEAVTLARHAVDLAPDEWLYWNTLGVSYYRAGRFHEAITALDKSLRTSAGQSGAFDLYFLAMCHHRLGNRDKGRALLTQARAWHEQQRGRPDYTEELRHFRREAGQVLGTPYLRISQEPRD